MKALSAKELRTGMPKILKKVEAGEEFVLIYRSRPVGQLIPLRKNPKKGRHAGIYALLNQPLSGIRLGSGETAVDLIRAERD